VEINLLMRAAGADLASCLDALEPALLQRLVVAADAGPGVYRFAHALVREVVADDLSPLHRARLHVQVADALDDDDDSAEILAEHLWAAVPIGVGARAAVALERAAHVAISRLAYRAALDLLERAVQLRRVGGPDPDDPDGELRAIALLVAVIGAHKGYPALLDSPHVARGKLLAARRGPSAAREGFALTWAEWAGLDVTCQFDRADPIAAELLEAAAGVEIPIAHALAHAAAGISAWHHGRIVEAAEHLDRAAAIGGEIEPGASLSMLFDVDQLRLAAPFSVYVHDLMGDHDDPMAAYERLVRQSPGGHWESLVLTFAASGALTTGDAERAIEAARRGVALDPERVAAFWTSQLVFYLGAGLCLAGRFEEGEPIFEDGRRACDAVGQRTNTTTIVCARAIGLSFAGRPDEARAGAADARFLLERDRERHAEPNVMVAEALVLLADGDEPAAAATLAAAAALADAQGSGAVAARVRRDAARVGIHLPGS
jgi:tetratricopeptide (TPR) repeat protein